MTPIFVCNFAQIQSSNTSLSQDKKLMNEKTSLTALLTITRSSKLLSRAGLNERDCRPTVAHIESVPQTSSTAVQLQHTQKREDFFKFRAKEQTIMVTRILHILIVGIVSLTSLSACRDYDIESNNSLESHDNAVGAYMNLAFSITSNTSNTSSTSRETRVGGSGGVGGGDKGGVASQSFLHWAEWEGNDAIEKVYAYIFKASGSDFTYETTKEFTGNQFTASGTTFSLKEPFEITAGNKQVFVVVNPNTRIANKIEAAITAGGDSYTASAFKTFLQSSGWSNPNIPTAPTSEQTQTRADEFVRNINGKDVIVMTGEPVNVSVTAAPKQQVQNFSKNTVTLNVERVVAKVLVSISKDLSLHATDMKEVYDTPRKYKFAITQIRDINDGTSTAYLSDLTWTVVQGANDLYLLKKPAAATENITFEYKKGSTSQSQVLTTEETTVKGKKIDKADFWQMVTPEYANFSDYYDYSGLWKKGGNPNIPYGFDVISIVKYHNYNDKKETDNVKAAAGGHCEYLFPTFVGKDTPQQRGNTPYILIRALFQPLKYYTLVNGQVEPMYPTTAGYAFNTPKTFYFDPITNIFGDSPEALKAFQREHNITAHDAILKYEGGYVYYFLLPNANKPTDKNTSDYSPILRNQFYHVQITAVTDMGFPWNSLVPYPKGTHGSSSPILANPQNPNPRPADDAGTSYLQTAIHPYTLISDWIPRRDNKTGFLGKVTRSAQEEVVSHGLEVTYGFPQQ